MGIQLHYLYCLIEKRCIMFSLMTSVGQNYDNYNGPPGKKFLIFFHPLNIPFPDSLILTLTFAKVISVEISSHKFFFLKAMGIQLHSLYCLIEKRCILLGLMTSVFVCRKIDIFSPPW